MDPSAAGVDRLIGDGTQWPLSPRSRMGKVPFLVQGEMQGRAFLTTEQADSARAATRSPAEHALPPWQDVTAEDIGFLRARLARLQANVAAADTAIMALYAQRQWAPHAGVALRHLVNHGFPELEDRYIVICHGLVVLFVVGSHLQ